jgi:hypothetical protein
MADVTPIRADVPVPGAPKRKRRAPRGPRISVDVMDEALNEQRAVLFQAMGIIRMARNAIQGRSSYEHAATDAWTALDAAYERLCSIADRLEDSETMLADEVTRGDY